MGGSYFGQNMGGENILAASVLLNYPKVCPLTKIERDIADLWFSLSESEKDATEHETKA